MKKRNVSYLIEHSILGLETFALDFGKIAAVITVISLEQAIGEQAGLIISEIFGSLRNKIDLTQKTIYIMVN